MVLATLASPHYARRFGPSSYPSLHLGTRLKCLRVRAGYSQGELARKLGVDAAMTSRWECESSTRFRPVPGHHFHRLAEILEVPLSELTGSAVVDSLPTTSVRHASIDDDLDELAVFPPATVVRSQPGRIVFSTDGVYAAPTPVPGRPGPDVWRIACWNCGRREPILDPEDLEVRCSRCFERLRARVTVQPGRARRGSC